MEAMDEGAYDRELEHRTNKEKATRRWSEIKADAEQNNIATPRYNSSARHEIDPRHNMKADGTDAISQKIFDERTKSNLIEAIKKEIVQDDEFRQRLLNEVQPILRETDSVSDEG